MKKEKLLIILIVLSLMFNVFGACKKEVDFDRLVYKSHNNPSKYRKTYEIEITKTNIVYKESHFKKEIDSKNKIKISSTDTIRISLMQFEQIKNEVFKEDLLTCKSNDICGGGNVENVSGYLKGEKVFSNSTYGCGSCHVFSEFAMFLNSFKTKK